MPQLVKGGKWVFGWVVVSPGNEIRIPPVAFAEYGFQAGETIFLTRGSDLRAGLASAGRKNWRTLRCGRGFLGRSKSA